MLVIALSGLLTVALASPAAAAPLNDNFANARAISGESGTINGTTVGATKEPGEPNHAGFFGGASIWYRWTAPRSGPVVIETCGSAFDTLLAVYTGTAVNALSPVAANDDSTGCESFRSKVSFAASAGTTYRIAIDGFGGASGTTVLNWRMAPGAPTNVAATPGVGSATVSFTPPASNGGSPITSYKVTSNPGGITASGSSSPITVTGLTNETAYTFTVYATNAVGNGPPSAPSNEVTPSLTPAYGVSDVTVVEGNSASKLATFTVTRYGNTTATSSVKYSTANGTAIAPGDYVAKGLTGLSFAAGQTSKTVSVSVKGDVVLEADETFTLNLSAPAGATIFDGTGVGTITNDDSADPATFSVSDASVIEGNSGTKLATFTVTRSGSTAASASVKFATANGTAIAPGDYVARGLTGLSFAIGQTTKTVTVSVKGDLLLEPNETFTLNLSAPVRATIVDGIGVGTITNDDSGDPTTLSVNDMSIIEGNSLTKTMSFTITRSGNLAGTSSVKFATADGPPPPGAGAVAPGDYTAKALTNVSFAAGQSTKTVAVVIKGEKLVEPDETFTLNLSAPVGATISDGTGTGTILNDD